MGVCPSLSPEERAIKNANSELKSILQQELKDLYMYNFSSKLRASIPEMAPRYLLNEGIIEDIDKLKVIARKNQLIKTEALQIQSLQQEIKNSCLIIEDEILNKDNKQQMKPEDMNNSFQKNLAQHQSIVVQLNILYKQEFQIEKYNQSLKFFLKWGNVFQEHCYGGFLKPLYKQFCQALYKLPYQECQTIVDEVSVFVQYMVTIYTHVYDLKELTISQNGQLFKNENIYNLIMSFMFKRTKINKFVRKMIHAQDEKKIVGLSEKLNDLKNKNLEYFQVDPQFIIEPSKKNKKLRHIEEEQKQSLNTICSLPYASCIKLVQDLSSPSQTPITKLKIIVQVSKKIMKEIYDYYDITGTVDKKIPELDPDNLTSIIMYLICRAGKVEIYQQLKIVEYFTTTNCLNCISGFYLNTFSAAIQSILLMK